MDINKALAELRAAFPRVTWVLDDEFGYIFAAGFLNLTIVAVLPVEDGMWDAGGGKGQHFKSPDPVTAVRAWLAAQPTAAFYPEAPSAALTECRGTLVMYAAGAWGMAGFSDTGDGDTARRHAFLLAEADPRASGAWTECPVVVWVPAPVDPPVLVGEVSDV